MMIANTLSLATAYRDAGLSVVPIPCDGSKSVARETWKELQDRLPTDDELLKDFGGAPRGIGIVGGKVSGNLTIIDIIDDGELVEPYQELVEEWCPGLLDQLPQVRSPRDGAGLHIYFRSGEVAGNEKLAERPTADENGKPSKVCMIETRAAGGYVVAPGSDLRCHETGRPYQLINGDLTQIPKIHPQEREALLRAARMFNECHESKKTKRGPATTSNGDGARPGDIFNQAADWADILTPHGYTLVKQVRDVRYWRRSGKTGRGHSATTGYCSDGSNDLLYMFSKNAHPLEDKCSYSKFAVFALLNHNGDFSSAGKALAARGYGGKPQANGAQHQGDDSTRGDGKVTAAEVEWEAPANLEMASVPDWPAEGVMPDALHEFVAALAEETQVPQDMVAIPALAMFAIAAAKKFRVQCPVHQEPLNFFAAVVAPPSDRKSAVMRTLMEPIHSYEQEVNAELAPEIAIYESRKRTLAAKLKAAESVAAKSAEGMEQMNAERDRDNLAKELAELEKNAVRKLVLAVSGDTTVERLVGILTEQGGRLGMIDSEGVLFSLARGKYSKNSEPSVDVYNQGYSSDPIRQHRISRPPVEVYKPALTIALFVQPEILRGMVKDSHLHGTGLLSRFFYVLPKSYVGHRCITPDRIPADVKGVYHRMIRKLLDLQVPTDEFGEPMPHILTMDHSATSVYLDFAERVEVGLREGGDLDGINYWGGKIVGGMARLSGILHVIEHGAAGTIGKSTMEGAVKVGSYLIEHAKAAFAEMKTDPDLDLARRLAKWLASAGLTEFSRRDAQQKLGRGVARADDLDQPLQILGDSGYIAELPQPSQSGPGRPPSVRFLVNPLLGEGEK